MIYDFSSFPPGLLIWSGHCFSPGVFSPSSITSLLHCFAPFYMLSTCRHSPRLLLLGTNWHHLFRGYRRYPILGQQQGTHRVLVLHIDLHTYLLFPSNTVISIHLLACNLEYIPGLRFYQTPALNARSAADRTEKVDKVLPPRS